MLPRQHETVRSKMTNPRTRKSFLWPLRLLPVPFLALGTWLTWVTATEFYMERQSNVWPRTSGTLHIKFDEHRKNISYQYHVNGSTYSSIRVAFGEIGNRKRSREWDKVASLPDGSTVEVFYMPDNPQNSTLARELCNQAYPNLLFGFTFLFIGALGAILLPVGFKKFAEQDTPSKLGSSHEVQHKPLSR